MRRGMLVWAMALVAALSLLCGRAEAADRHAGRRMMASRYEMHGLLDKAVAEYLKILASDPDDPQAKARAMSLISTEIPTWLPQEAEGVFPFAHEVLVWEGAGRDVGGGEGPPPPASTSPTASRRKAARNARPNSTMPQRLSTAP